MIAGGKWRALLAFELVPVLKGPLPWAALAGLILLEMPMRFLLSGNFSVNGEALAQPYRLVYVVAIGYSTIVFLCTLLALSLCLDRAGANYLRNNDLLALSRSLSRPAFYLVKMASVLLPVIAYGALALTLFWVEVYRLSGANLHRLFLLVLPLALSLGCLVSLYFLMRNFLGNFMIFFLWLLILPVLYVGNLWRYYGGMLREGTPEVPILGLLPQFGGIHAHSLGMIHDFYFREETWRAIAGGLAWTAAAVIVGLVTFSRKRL